MSQPMKSVRRQPNSGAGGARCGREVSKSTMSPISMELGATCPPVHLRFLAWTTTTPMDIRTNYAFPQRVHMRSISLGTFEQTGA